MNPNVRLMGEPHPHGSRSEHWFDRLLACATRIPRRRAWAIVALILVVTGLLDRSTASEAWWGPMYLLVICLATWTLGGTGGFAIGFACAGIATLANGIDLYPAGPVAFIWNLAMRVLAVAIIVVLIGSARRSYDREWRRARTDALTGALNKDGFFEMTADERWKDQWGVLGYIDLDGLKPINDRYGHAAGDDVLRAFTRSVQKCIRATDVFARVGGDEFLVYQVVRSEEEAYHLARDLHARMNGIQTALGLVVKCSMGAVVIEPQSSRPTEADVDLADLLMYDAKRKGAGLCIATRSGLADDTVPAALPPRRPACPDPQDAKGAPSLSAAA